MWFTLGVIAIAAGLDGLWQLLKLAHARRPRRPPLPDTFLPAGWLRWFPDGQGYARLYEWHPGRGWHELAHRRVRIPEDEPAES